MAWDIAPPKQQENVTLCTPKGSLFKRINHSKRNSSKTKFQEIQTKVGKDPQNHEGLNYF